MPRNNSQLDLDASEDTHVAHECPTPDSRSGHIWTLPVLSPASAITATAKATSAPQRSNSSCAVILSSDLHAGNVCGCGEECFALAITVSSGVFF